MSQPSPILPQADEALLAARERIMRWREGGPALFAVEALGVPAEWEPTLRVGVQEWQWAASKLVVQRRRLSVRAGRRVGKSAFMAWSILWFMTCYFPCKIPCTAPTAHQLGDVLWAELAKWYRHLKQRIPELGEQFEVTQDEFRMLEAPKESFAVARTARVEKPEALQGFQSEHILILIDEASGVPDIIWEVGQGALAGIGSFVILAGNPNRTSGFFFDSHHKNRERWGILHVNGETCPLQDQQFRDDIAHQYGRDSNVYRVHVLGEFPTAEDDVVIPLELCESARLRDVDAFGQPVWGIDVARFGSDRTVLVKRCDNATLEPHQAWSGVDTMQTSGRIFSEWQNTLPEKRPKAIFVDLIGIGAGVHDRLLELGLPVSGINVAEVPSADDHYSRLRDELWFKGRKWLEKRHCKLVPDDTLIAELSLPKYSFTSSGKIKVESKDDLKKRYPRSPDVADAFLLTFADAAEYSGKGSFDPPYYEDF